MLKGAAGTVLLHVLTGGPARAAAKGAAPSEATARLRVATFSAPDPASAAYAIDVLRGLELWASSVSPGSEAHLTVGSGSTDPDIVARWYDSVATDADVLVAPYGSRLTGVAFEVAEARRVPCVAPSAGDPDLWDGRRRWSVDVLEPTPTFFDGVLEMAMRRPHALRRDVAMVYRDDPFSRSVMAGAARRAAALGFTRVVRHRFHDARERAAAARAAAAATVLAIGFQSGTAGEGFLDDAVGIARALPPTRDAFIALGVGAADPAFGPAAGAAAEGVVGVTGWRPYLPTRGNPAFLEAYRARWHRTPTAHAAQGYAAGQVVARAVTLAEATTRPRPTNARESRDDSPRVRRNALRGALHVLDIDTVFGRYRVDEGGRQVGHRPALVRWKDGKVMPLEMAPSGGPDGAAPSASPTRRTRA